MHISYPEYLASSLCRTLPEAKNVIGIVTSALPNSANMFASREEIPSTGGRHGSMIATKRKFSFAQSLTLSSRYTFEEEFEICHEH